MSRWAIKRIRTRTAIAAAALCAAFLVLPLAAGCGQGGKEAKVRPKSGGVMGEAIEYPGGTRPSLAATEDGWIVEAHEGATRDQVWYNVGRFADDGSFKWQGDPIKSGTGVEPGIAITDAGYVVMVHRARNGNGLWYETGMLDKNTGKISWLHEGDYDTGSYPSVIAFNDRSVIETHLSTVGHDHWYRVGIIDTAGNTVDFGGSASLEGTKVLAAFKDTDRFVQLFGDGFRFGRVDRENRAIAWIAPKWERQNVATFSEYDREAQGYVSYYVNKWDGASAYAYNAPGAGPQVVYAVYGYAPKTNRDEYIGRARVDDFEGNPMLNNINFSPINGGTDPAIACSGRRAIEMHKGPPVGSPLWYSTATLEPR